MPRTKQTVRKSTGGCAPRIKFLPKITEPKEEEEEVKTEESSDEETIEQPVVKKSKRQHISVKDEGDVEKKAWTPKNWPESYENIKKMMDGVVAPCESLPWFVSKDPKEFKPLERFRILVALMLGSRTKDNKLMETWNTLCDKGLSIDWVLKTDTEELATLIKGCSFYNVKAGHIKQTATILKEEHKGDTPDTLKEVSDLPGVGSKMAVIFLQCCYGKVEGIGPDGDIVRAVNRLHWVPKPVNCHTRTRNQLEAWLPKDTMLEFNRLISRFGQVKCTDKPKCNQCLNKNICPSAKKTKK